MPVNGLVFEADAVEFFLESSGSGSHTGAGTGSYGHSASGDTYYTPDTVTLSGAFVFALSGASAANTWQVDYTGPGAPLGTSWTGSGWTPITASIVFSAVKIYNTGGTFRVVCDYEVFAQGVSRLTGSIDTTSGGMGPAYLPLWGVPFGLTGGASASTTGLPAYGPTDTYTYYSDCTGTAEGGWHIDQGSGYVALPVTLAPGSAPAMGGACTDPGVGTVTAGDSDSLSVTSYASAEVTRSVYASGTITECCTQTYCDGILIDETCTTQPSPVDWAQYELDSETFGRGGYVRAIPDLEKAIKRFNADFKALVYRSEMPQTEYSATWTCNFDGAISSGGGSTEVHPHQAEILQEVGPSTATMEDTFSYNSYAPWTQSGSWGRTKSYEEVSGAVICPDGVECPGEGQIPTIISILGGYTPMPDNESYSASRAYAFPSYVGPSADMVGYLGHTAALARYVNSWCNPHWSYALWNESWEVDSSPETWADYWQLVGSQWLYNAALASPSESRNHLVSEPLDQDGNAGFLDTFFGGLRWLGLSRWQTKTISPRLTYAYTSASSSLWSGEDCSIAHGSAITVTSSAASCEVRLSLGSFTVEPFMWVHLADKILCDWTATNVTSIKVYLESVDGARVLLNDNDPNVEKDRPYALGRKYAGSWAQDFGAGITTDTGSDFTPARGRSSAAMADSALSYALQGLSDRTAAKLVYVIVPTNPAATVSIDYPEFEYSLSGDRLDCWENAYQCATVHPSGPGVRTGQWFTGTSGTIINPPGVYDPTTRPTLVDWLITERLVVEGIAHDSGLTTELTTLYDTYEGQSVGQVRGASNAFWLPHGISANWLLACVNSMSEIPPMGCLPRMERNTSWAETGDYVQHVWSFAQDYSLFIAPVITPELRTDDDVTVWTSTGTGVTGWAVTRERHALDNTEDDFGIWVNETGKRLGVVRPWRGHYFINRVPEALNTLAYAVRPDLMNYRGRVSGGSATVEAADNALSAWAGVGSTVTAEELCLAVKPYGPILLGVIDAGSYKLYQSTGGSWTLSYTVTSTGTPVNPCVIAGSDGVVFHYWADAGTVKGRRYDGAGTALGSAFSVSGIGAIDEEGISGDESYGATGERVIRLLVVVSGSLTVYTSTDGEAFS